MTQAARTSSPVFGWTSLLAATSALVIALIVALMPSETDNASWKTLPSPSPPPLPVADQSGLAPVDDIRMWYAVFNKGGGNPVLLIHGGLENGDTWGNQVPALARTREVIIADSRGHGRSTRSTKPVRISADGRRLCRPARSSDGRQGGAGGLE